MTPIGQTFGRLTILAQIGKRGRHRIFRVRCNGCGAEYPANESAVKRNVNGCASCTNNIPTLKRDRKLWQYGKLERE